jgi:hypothetical protein
MPTNRATGPAAQATEPTVTPTATETEDSPQFVSRDEFQQMTAKMDKIFGTMGSVLEKISGAQQKKADEQKDATLNERVRKIEEREAALRQKSARDSIAAALIASGADVAIATKQAQYLQAAEFSGRMQIDEDGTAFYKDGEQLVPIADHVRAYLQTEGGKWLLPAKRPPTDKGAASGRTSANSATGVREIAWSDYVNRKMTAQDLADLKSGKATIGQPES